MYISSGEPKSVREVYTRVAVIDIDITVGMTNIYIGGGKGDVRSGYSPQLVAGKHILC